MALTRGSTELSKSTIENTNSESDVKEPSWRPFFIAVVAIIVILATYSVGIRYIGEDWTARGQFGDSYGAMNALFSGIAFAALVYTMILQKAELRLQRKELEETRSEIRAQRVQLEAQTQTFTQQSFENTFFKLIELHHKIVNSTDTKDALKSGDDLVHGRDCFDAWCRIFVYFCHNKASNNSRDLALWDRVNGAKTHMEWLCEEMPEQFSQSFLDVWEEQYVKHRSDLGHYFRNFYHIVKLVDSQFNLTSGQKQSYASILRAQLSSGEIGLLFYNGLPPRGSKFKPLIEQYALLKNLESDQLVLAKHRAEYHASAFGSAPVVDT
jgi:hypothetical protein